jgi:predicted alpha/beta superfamily hydrolase
VRAEPLGVPFVPCEALSVTSATGAEYRISVGLPVSYATTDRRYPVLYVLDGDYFFYTLLELSRQRGVSGETGEIIVVGIGYPLDTDLAHMIGRREYEFSTADWDRSSIAYRDLEAVLAALGQPLRIGGAPALLDFLMEELQPLIANRYRADAGDQALFGCSAGGNFAGIALFTRPDAFGKLVIASPGFVFNDFGVLRQEEEYARTHDDLSVTLYVGAGAGETQQMANGAIVSGAVRFVEALQLRGYPSLRLTSEIFTGKTHITATTEVMHRGLEVCWPGTPYVMTAERAAQDYCEL